MKKLLIAGYSDSTANYQHAFAKLGASFDTLPPKSGNLTSARKEIPSMRSLSKLSYCPLDYDGLVLPGGGDIAPVLFGAQDEGSRDIDQQLDCLQLRTLKTFLEAEKPVLGICKGLQIINVHFGGTILQDLPEHSHKGSRRDLSRTSLRKRARNQQRPPSGRGNCGRRAFGGAVQPGLCH